MKNTYTTSTTGVTFKSERNDIRYVLTVRGDDGIWRVRNRSADNAAIHVARFNAETPYSEAGYTVAMLHEIFKVETVRKEVK